MVPFEQSATSIAPTQYEYDPVTQAQQWDPAASAPVSCAVVPLEPGRRRDRLAMARSLVAHLRSSGRLTSSPPGSAYLVIVAMTPQQDPSPQEPPQQALPQQSSPVARWRPRTVKRAIDTMEADPARDFTVGDLAAAADVGVRALQTAFRRHTGMTPMAYLRDLRLSRVHADLLVADPRTTKVAEVAHRWGFSHLGRLAAAYRRRYGISPSATLRARHDSGGSRGIGA